MARVGEGGRLKKNNCCLTCSIISFIMTIVFFAAVFIAGNILFKKYVSPKIGGVGLTDSLSLAGKLLAGKETKESYSEDDLDDFYSGLSSSLFMSDKTEDELEYELLDDEAKASLDMTSAAAEEGGKEVGSAGDTPTYDNDAAYAAFLLLSKNARYALLSDSLKSSITLEEYGSLASEGGAAVRKRLGLKTYRVSIGTLLGGEDFSSSNFSAEKMADRAFDSIDFNFESLEDYDINDPDAPQNTEFTTFSVTGKQVSAFINDVMNFFLSSDSSSLGEKYSSMLPEGKTLGDYVRIASVTIKNSPILVSGKEAVYDQKDTELGVTISIRLRELVKAMMNTEDVKSRLQSAPSFAVGMIPKIVPKYLSVSAFIYPLADDADQREMRIKVNKMTDKNAKNLSLIVNGIMKKSSSDSEETAEKNFFRDLNDQVVDIFKKINEKVKINFVPSLDKEGNALKDSSGKTYSELRIMTIETLLSLLDNSGSLSAHEIFTVLKCLYVTENTPAALSLGDNLNSFKSEVSSKYGVDLSFLNENNLLSSDALGSILEHINLAKGGVDFSLPNEQMKVELSAEVLGALMMDVLSAQDEKQESVAAAESESAANLLKGLVPEICSIVIDKAEEKGGEKIYTLELLLSINLSDLVKNVVSSGENTTSKLATKILPKGRTYFGVKLFLSEKTVDGVVVHTAGKNISENSTAYETKFRVNDFSYDQTDSVIETINKFMTTLGNSSDFDLSSMTGQIEDLVTNLFDKLQNSEFKISVRMFEKNDTSQGGILLPSIYEIVECLVAPRLEGEDTFTATDAQQILALVYDSKADKSVTFLASQADELLEEVNDKFYISHDSAIKASDLFGEGASNLSDKIKADSIYFKPSAEEQSKWSGGYVKPALFKDTRTMNELRVALTGGEIAALIEDLNLLPEDLSSSFGNITILGASFKTENGATYLNFDVLCAFKQAEKSESSGESSTDLSVLFPENVKITFTVLMSADSYSEAAPRFSSSLKINDSEAAKIFTLLKAFGGSSLSPSALSEKIKTSLSPVFTALEEKIPVYYSNAGAAYTRTVKGKTENCIYLADVFTALVNLTHIKDAYDESTGTEIPEENRTETSPATFREKLMEFGRMPSFNFEGESDTWSVDVSGIDTFFTEGDLNSFLAELKSDYYLNSDVTAENIMGESTSFDVNASSVSFPSLYADERAVSELNVPLTGNALGALVKKTLGVLNMGEDASATLVQCAIRIDDKGSVELSDDKLFLDLALLVNLTGSSSILPTHIFVKAEVDLSYDFVNDRFPNDLTCSAAIKINNLTSNKTKNMFGYIGTLGGSFSMDTITDKVSESIEDGIKKMIALYPEGTVTVSDDSIVLPDVFTFLINVTHMPSATAEQLASRLRGFGYQLNAHGDPTNASVYTWVNDLKLFVSTDDKYVYTNMQRAYFMKDGEENKPNLDDIYDGVGGLFSTIDDSSFKLTGDDGLYRYSGDIKTLKISDKALGVMIKSKQSFSAAVTSDVGASLESVRIFLDNGDLRIETGIKITLGNNEAYAMLPEYFFVKALTKEDGTSLNGYSTTISVNNLSRAETVAFFTNFASLSSVGVSNSAFNINKLETEINKAIGTALSSFTSSVPVTYGTFTSADITNEYNATNYPTDQISLQANDGYMQIPSIYYFMIDLLYNSNEPTEGEMQHMLNKLYETDEELTLGVVKNASNGGAFNKTGVYRGDNSITDVVAIYSDKYVGSLFSSDLNGHNINGNIEIQGIRQAIVIRANDTDVQDEWRSKFFAQNEDFNATHNYMIATAVADLSNYSSGSDTSLVPTYLWFTVLIDLTVPTESRGLLYDMSARDMEIFEHILSSNNTSFNINLIAVELANVIINNIQSIAGVGMTVRYYAAADSYLYSESLPFTGNEIDAANATGGKGYIVVSLS